MCSRTSTGLGSLSSVQFQNQSPVLPIWHSCPALKAAHGVSSARLLGCTSRRCFQFSAQFTTISRTHTAFRGIDSSTRQTWSALSRMTRSRRAPSTVMGSTCDHVRPGDAPVTRPLRHLRLETAWSSADQSALIILNCASHPQWAFTGLPLEDGTPNDGLLEKARAHLVDAHALAHDDIVAELEMLSHRQPTGAPCHSPAPHPEPAGGVGK